MPRLSRNVDIVLKMAYEIALKTQGDIGTENLLFGLTVVKDSIASRLLEKYGLTDETFNRSDFDMTGTDTPVLTPRAKKTLSEATVLAGECRQDFVGTEHILMALLYEKDSRAYYILENAGVNIPMLSGEVTEILSQQRSGGGYRTERTSARFDNRYAQSEAFYQQKNGADAFTANAQQTEKEENGLDAFGVDLTQRAREGKLDPVIGRTKEVERIIQVLCRRTKNNPVLIGEPGVGKSAIAEGLAQDIINDKVPDALKGKRVFMLDMASIVAGTKYRGEFEERFKKALETVKKAGNIILFIDEIHTIVKAGGAEGAIDAASILKPMLARGEIQTIGATTIDEYRQYIEKDAALERRFQPIVVDQPTVEDTVLILKGLRDKYEAHHKVRITDEAIEAAANLSDRYITDRFLPDKAIDLIDEAASRKRIFSFSLPDNIKKAQDKLDALNYDIKEASENENFDKAKQLTAERDKLREIVKEGKESYDRKKAETDLSIGEADIAEIVSNWTSIPVAKISEDEASRLMRLEDTLKQRVIGQDEAVSAVARAIKRARAGISDPKRPIGSFIFLGPTGVGKTELSKALAEAMFGDEKLLIRVDMSEYMEKYNVSKLIGAAPGYVGFDEGGQLTEKVRRKPYSVILFDEIEKAHPDVFNILLQILEDGRLTDSHGRTVSFKNTIIIMTSNIGAAEIRNNKRLGFGDVDEYEDMKEKQMEALKSVMKPEFINRIDEIVIFRQLEKADLDKVADIMFKTLEKRLEKRGIAINILPEAKDFIVEKGYDKEYGARPLRRTIQRLVEDALSEKILEGVVATGDRVDIGLADGELTFAKSAT